MTWGKQFQRAGGKGARSHGRNGKLGGKERRARAELEEVVRPKAKLEGDRGLRGRKEQTGGWSRRPERGRRDGQKLRRGIRLEEEAGNASFCAFLQKSHVPTLTFCLPIPLTGLERPL